ncbi:hypothetical protein GOV09_07135 [Candidatus Woesearchaeota archaeon]|nr:hypothetical protein [Candidatus Woesearchaeota archaeon]
METEKAHIRVRAILDIVGKPKEFVEKKLKEYIDHIKEDVNLMVMDEKISPAIEQDNYFSAIAELEVVIKGVQNLVGFCIDYMPASIDIIKPDTITFAQRDFTGFVNDMLGKLHNVDMAAKQSGSENELLKKNMTSVIRNNILVLLKFKINTIDGMCKATGIPEDELKRFLELLKKEGRIVEKEEGYDLA